MTSATITIAILFVIVLGSTLTLATYCLLIDSLQKRM